MMNTAIMLSLLVVSGIVLVISEGNKLFGKINKHSSAVKTVEECTDRGDDDDRFPNDKNTRVNLLDFSGGTMGI